MHGSLGFGEWHPHSSDVDFVAVASRRPGEHEVRLLRDVHARVGETFARPPYDGCYVTWDDLARSPYDCPDVPGILAGDFRDEGRVDVNPVTWHELARHGVTVRGQLLEEVEVWADRQVLREYTHGNLAGYWAGSLAELRRFPEEGARPHVVSWFVLGTSRLHHVLATGELTSKDGAGRYAVRAFGERWRPLVAEALAHRVVGELTGALSQAALVEQVPAFSEMVIGTGLEIPV